MSTLHLARVCDRGMRQRGSYQWLSVALSALSVPLPVITTLDRRILISARWHITVSDKATGNDLHMAMLPPYQVLDRLRLWRGE